MQASTKTERAGAKTRRRALLAVLIVVALLGLAAAARMNFDPRDFTAWLASRRAVISANLPVAVAAYAAFYVVYAALPLPMIWVVSVTGGMLFGPWLGFPLVATCSTAGATVAMLASRYLFREAVATRFPVFVERVDRGVARDGAHWLFAARLTPVVPYFAVNLAVGLTGMPALVFALVSLLGVLPLALLFVLAGSEFATIEHPSDVLSLPIVAALLALAVAPFAVRALARWRRREI